MFKETDSNPQLDLFKSPALHIISISKNDISYFAATKNIFG